jgi:hypothetical protein
MYVFGRHSNDTINEALYADINGAWIVVNPPRVGLGQALNGPLQAGKQRFGEVFFGTSGSGVIYGKLGKLPPDVR